MKAVVVRAFTPLGGAEYGELEDPVPGPGEVVVGLKASEANFPDILYIEGTYQKLPPFPFSPGLAGAGRVIAHGAGVNGPEIGARVLVLPEYGTHAERVAVPANFCFPIPDEMPFETAAALGLVYQTAWFALMNRGGLQAGDNVLVLGATGGVGMAAVQLARALGAGRVLAATRGAEGAALAREFGADTVVDTTSADLRECMRDAVLAATNGHGADVVVDPVGGRPSAAALRALAWQGRMVIVGFASGEIPQVGANYLLVKNISVSGLQWTDYRTRDNARVHAAQARIFALWREGRIAPRIARRLPLARFADALADLRDARVSGKIILLPAITEE